MTEDILEQSYQYMLSHFRAWGDMSEYGQHQTYHLHLTHNGSQEEVISFYSVTEIDAAIGVLQELKEKGKPKIGIDYYHGKPKPYRAFRFTGNKTTYIGWFATKEEAWQALKGEK